MTSFRPRPLRFVLFSLVAERCGVSTWAKWTAGYPTASIMDQANAIYSGEVIREVKGPAKDGLHARSGLYDDYSDLVNTATSIADLILNAGEIIDRVKTQLADREDDKTKELIQSGKVIQDSLDMFSDRFFGPQGKQGIYREMVAATNIVLVPELEEIFPGQ